MTLFVSEYRGNAPYRQDPKVGTPCAMYNLSSAAAVSLQAGTKYIRVSADVGTLLNNSTTSGTLTLTSTNSIRVSPNVPGELFAVSTNFKLQAAST